LLAYALGQALLQAAEVLTLVLLALFLAVSLEPLVAGLVRLRLRRGLAAMVVLLGVAALFGVFIALVVPPVSNEISALAKAIPVWLKELHDHHSALGRLEDRYHIIEKVQQQLTSGGLGSRVASGVLGAGQLILGAVTGAFIGITQRPRHRRQRRRRWRARGSSAVPRRAHGLFGGADRRAHQSRRVTEVDQVDCSSESLPWVRRQVW
jgi:hypothetical protein